MLFRQVAALSPKPIGFNLAPMPAWLWLQRVQLAAAQWVANIESRHRLPLEQSSLIDILRGPIDWVMDAAVIALTRRVCEEQLDPNWLCEQFFTLLNRLPEEGYWSTRKVTLHHILLLPDTVITWARRTSAQRSPTSSRNG